MTNPNVIEPPLNWHTHLGHKAVNPPNAPPIPAPKARQQWQQLHQMGLGPGIQTCGDELVKACKQAADLVEFERTGRVLIALGEFFGGHGHMDLSTGIWSVAKGTKIDDVVNVIFIVGLHLKRAIPGLPRSETLLSNLSTLKTTLSDTNFQNALDQDTRLARFTLAVRLLCGTNFARARAAIKYESGKEALILLRLLFNFAMPSFYKMIDEFFEMVDGKIVAFPPTEDNLKQADRLKRSIEAGFDVLTPSEIDVQNETVAEGSAPSQLVDGPVISVAHEALAHDAVTDEIENNDPIVNGPGTNSDIVRGVVQELGAEADETVQECSNISSEPEPVGQVPVEGVKKLETEASCSASEFTTGLVKELDGKDDLATSELDMAVIKESETKASLECFSTDFPLVSPATFGSSASTSTLDAAPFVQNNVNDTIQVLRQQIESLQAQVDQLRLEKLEMENALGLEKAKLVQNDLENGDMHQAFATVQAELEQARAEAAQVRREKASLEAALRPATLAFAFGLKYLNDARTLANDEA